MARYFPQATLDAITCAVAVSEQTHRGELRVIIEGALPLSLLIRGISPRQRAGMLFKQLGVAATTEHCGVLLYLQVIDRRIEIIADTGISASVPATEWAAICDEMAQAFRHAAWRDGILTAVARTGALLAQHFPAHTAKPNELPDPPLLI